MAILVGLVRSFTSIHGSQFVISMTTISNNTVFHSCGFSTETIIAVYIRTTDQQNVSDPEGMNERYSIRVVIRHTGIEMETCVCVCVGVLCFSSNSAFHHDNLLPQQQATTTKDTLHPSSIVTKRHRHTNINTTSFLGQFLRCGNSINLDDTWYQNQYPQQKSLGFGGCGLQ
jgi:hypothetical protein